MQKFTFPKINKKQKKIIFIVLGAVLLLFGGLTAYALSKREAILDSVVKKAQTKLKSDYGLEFAMEDYRFAGLATVAFHHLTLKPDSAEQLAYIEDLKVSVRLWPLIFGEVKIGLIDMADAKVTFVKTDSVSNYDFLFKKKSAQDSAKTEVTERNLAETADKLIKQVFFKIPKDMKLKNIEVSYQDSSTTQKVTLPEGEVDNGKYDILVFLNDNEAKWNFKGHVNPDKQELSVVVSSEDKGVELPVLGRKYGLHVSFDEVSFDLDGINRVNKNNLTLSGNWEVTNLVVNHWRLSDKDIILPNASGAGGLIISNNAVEIQEGTKVTVKDFEFKPFVKYIHSPKKSLALAVHTGKFETQKFFDAIPSGLFESIEGVQVAGDTQFDLDFEVAFDNPDSLKFTASVDDKNLKVTKWGNANISALNQPFVYKAYEDTLLVREIIVGPQNPNFRTLNQVAPILKKTVLNTEDPFFYEHNGFEEEAFKLSLVTNIKEKKFKRGASTISMQLVKNLFLNRNKTIMRKLEEILIVWLMESSHEVSKDRLFEIYLNVIEWGKNVYGINEASNYYFGKTASDLNLGESLYLSSIIPRPKTGLSSFDYTGHLKPWVQRHFNTYGYILNKRGQLAGEAVPEAYGFYGVQLQENLRPPRPKGIVDSTDMLQEWELEDMIKEIDQEENRKKSLIERLLGTKNKSEE
ncbi:transglycosylase domain-containing protein [Sphingobacterium hungaricum]|uniref:Penicillin-binding protein n=1 Tax=Sphingobacterium hungaricum TaxID=2082723 RepID=A0A928UUG9_9SPHI|nr:biosynthetic peptidoglycan transglycosylase [Sphingobacterium hungaricum]MBE8713138.1 penicillin-binding protein [Sphingobacterium hungaricum]